MFFYRVEHKTRINTDLTKYSSISIGMGPWHPDNNFSYDEKLKIGLFSKNHPTPYKTTYNYIPFDSEINKIVADSIHSIPKPNFIFGCKEKFLVNRYFPIAIRELLCSHGFHVRVYSSNHVFSSKYQSVLDILNPFSIIGSFSLN